jgi:hypothetical protein
MANVSVNTVEEPMKAAAFIVLLAVNSWAQNTTNPAPKNPVGTGVTDPTVDFYDSMSDYFRNTGRALRAINQKGIPVTDIPAVLLIARRSSASPNQIVDARKRGTAFEEIAKQNNVQWTGKDFVTEANLIFLSEYHGKPIEEVRSLHGKGADFIALNQEFRRDNKTPRATERSRGR